MIRIQHPGVRALGYSCSWLVGVIFVSACGSTSTQSVTGPSTPKCTVALAGPQTSMTASGGAGSVTVTTEPECTWSASPDASWIAQLAPTQGQGSGQVQFQVAANPSGSTRESAVTIGGQKATVRQDGAACRFDVSVSNTFFTATGGVGTATVTGPAGCAWITSSDVSWITVSAAGGTGAGSVSFNVENNGGTVRTGTLVVAGTTITVTEASGAPVVCNISLQPTSMGMPAAGGPGSVTIAASAECTWTATSGVPWITITPPVSGSGSGSKAFTVATNTLPAARSGVITIGGATLTVNQAAAVCAPPSITPTSQSFAGPGGPGTLVAVTAGVGCAWTSTSNAPWLTITSGAGGTGNGTVGFRVAPNTLTFRTGTLTIAGQTFTVSQAACTYEIDRTLQIVGDDGAVGAPVPVTTQAGCPWTSTADVSWLHLTSGASGTGNGTVNFTVDPFAPFTGSRTGSLTIAGKTSTVIQERCTATLTPANQSVSSAGGSFSVSLSTQTGCNWTATSNAVWLNPNGNSGTGITTVNYLVLPNGGGARTGRLTFVLSGETEELTVNQAKN